MRAPGYEKIQAGDDEDPGGQGSVSGARSEDTTNWLLIPGRSQEQLPQCVHIGLVRGSPPRPPNSDTAALCPFRPPAVDAASVGTRTGRP